MVDMMAHFIYGASLHILCVQSSRYFERAPVASVGRARIAVPECAI